MRGDLHIHSTASGDGRQSVEDILRRCREQGLKVVAITDHNSMDGYPVRADDIIVRRGMEITAEEGHVLAYHITEPVPRGRGVEETIDLIHGQGGIAIAPHPYRWWSGLKEANVRGRRFDGVEVLNGRSLRSSNARAGRLAKSMAVAEVGGSDAHVPDHVGRAYTVFPEDCQNAEDLVKAIRDRRTAAGGESRKLAESFTYGTKSILRWARRGFKRL
jgi:predicted metal-dependent phosphoesterase TrpH